MVKRIQILTLTPYEISCGSNMVIMSPAHNISIEDLCWQQWNDYKSAHKVCWLVWGSAWHFLERDYYHLCTLTRKDLCSVLCHTPFTDLSVVYISAAETQLHCWYSVTCTVLKQYWQNEIKLLVVDNEMQTVLEEPSANKILAGKPEVKGPLWKIQT